MIRVSVTRADATVTETETLTAGRVGLECAFAFSADWNGLQKVAVFEGAETIEVALGTANVAVVPPECMTTAGFKLRCGAYGLSAAGDIVIPTIWAKAGKIKESSGPDDESLAPATPALVAQIIAKANSAEETANSIKEQASRGEFDGFSPYVGVTETENGHRVSITDSTGTKDFDVMDGADGEDGVSPTIAVSDITGGHVLTITDKNGTRTVNVLNGEDGVSPAVSITTITGGHRVIITDADGDHTFDVMDGEDAPSGTDEVFWAVYGLTGAVELQTAYDAGKVCLCKYQGNVYVLSSKTDDDFHFTCIPNDGTSLYRVSRTAASGWVGPIIKNFGTYSKPSGGIPKSDLASTVQGSLNRADQAYQKPSAGIPASDLASGVIPTVPTKTSELQNDSGFLTLATLPIYNGGVA